MKTSGSAKLARFSFFIAFGVIGWALPAFAEAPNPFGGVNPNGGQNNDFPEEDEFPPDSGFGFTPPQDGNGNAPFAPPPPPIQAENDPGEPPAFVPPPPSNFTPPPPSPGAGNRTRGRVSSPPPMGATPSSSQGFTPPNPTPKGTNGTASTSKTPPQKLQDYLELDPAVRGLEVKNFDLPDKEIKDVVTLISKWTGKNFILDNKVRGKITIIGPSQVTLQEAYQAFLSALEANGLTTVQSGKFIRVIESAEARRAPVKTYSGAYAPADDQFITRIFQLKYINADEVQKEFRDLTTRQGRLFAYEPTNSIIITDTGSNIQRIKEILETLDVKSFETTLHVLRIKNTSAKQIADMLGEIYGENTRQSGTVRTFRRSALERTRGGGIISKVIPEEGTNSLIILANEAGYLQLAKIVARLDVKVSDTGRIHVYYCEYAKAKDLAETLSALSQGGSGAGSSRSTNRRTSVATGGPGAPPGGTPAAGGGPAGPVSAELEGGVRITSDDATNALVITASASDYRTLKRVLKKLDIPRLQVFVETAIMELSMDDQDKWGINLAAGAPGSRGFAGGFIGDSSSITDFLVKGVPSEGLTIPGFTNPQFPATVGGTQVQVSSFMSLLNLISKNTATSILSTPQIIALDNEEAVFKVIDEIPVQSTFTQNQGIAGAVGTGTIERLKTGIEIKLTPQVNAASRTVRLKIEQSVDSLRSNNDVPDALRLIQKAKTSRTTNTSVVVKDEDYVMLSGMMADKVDESETKVPILGDIPILGWLFKSKTFSVVKTNLVILLKPRIIGTSLASSGIINENLEKRDRFIKEYSGGKDAHSERVNEMRNQIKDQENRGKQEPLFDYRNNEDDEEEEEKAKSKKRSESPLIPDAVETIDESKAEVEPKEGDGG